MEKSNIIFSAMKRTRWQKNDNDNDLLNVGLDYANIFFVDCFYIHFHFLLERNPNKLISSMTNSLPENRKSSGKFCLFTGMKCSVVLTFGCELK